MSEIERSEALFDSGPFPHFHRALGLFRPVGRSVTSRAWICIVIGWAPLVILVFVQGLVTQPSKLSPFLWDFGVHARSLVAVPLLILCERTCLPRLERIVEYFVNSHIIQKTDQPAFFALLNSTKRRINSGVVEAIAILLAFGIAAVAIPYSSSVRLPDWYQGPVNGVLRHSWAGLWYAAISLPLLLILIFGWLWRLHLWGRLLFKVSRMKLSLIAAHPDRAAGLGFLNSSLVAFTTLAFTLGVIPAGSVANNIVNFGQSLKSAQNTVLGLLIVVTLLFVSPLMIFVFNFYFARLGGIFRYGKLAHDVGEQFENKWLSNFEKYGPGALEASDFSATTDLYQIVANVHDMKFVPFELRALIFLFVATLIPFIPVVVISIPLKVILKELASLFL